MGPSGKLPCYLAKGTLQPIEKGGYGVRKDLVVNRKLTSLWWWVMDNARSREQQEIEKKLGIDMSKPSGRVFGEIPKKNSPRGGGG